MGSFLTRKFEIQRLQKLLLHFDSGSVLVEFSIVFPLFLLIIFIILFIGVIHNAETSLSSAVKTAALAYTRGQEVLAGSKLISAVQDWDGNELRNLLTSPGLEAQWPWYYDRMAMANIAGAGNFKDLRDSGLSNYIYAHIYAIQSMKQSVGPSVRYPCDPEGSSTNDGSGCLKCKNITPSYIDNTPENPLDGPTIWDSDYNFQFIGIECSFKPGNELLNPIYALFKLIMGGSGMSDFTMTRRFYVDFSGEYGPI